MPSNTPDRSKTNLAQARGHWAKLRQEGAQISAKLPRRWTALLSSVAVFVLCEFGGSILDRIPTTIFSGVQDPPRTGDLSSLVTTLVAAAATFLALYLTTIGVIASTRYQRVPVGVRELFLNQRAGRTYSHGLAQLLILGLMVLGSPLVGYRPHVLSVIAMMSLALTAIVRLLLLGTGLFRFYDVTHLIDPLRGDLRDAVLAAADPEKRSPDAQVQAYERAARVLTLYQRIVEVAIADSSPGESHTRIARVLAEAGATYAEAKPTIPRDSGWWPRTPRHPDWFRVSGIELQMAIQTDTPIQPRIEPDFLWFEQALTSALTPLTNAVFASEATADLGSAVEELRGLIRLVAAQSQLLEAKHYREVLLAKSMPLDSLRSARAELFAVTLTDIVLGFAQHCLVVAAADVAVLLDQQFDQDGSGRRYEVPLPHTVIAAIEELKVYLAREHEIEDTLITPRWWCLHQVGRVYTQELSDGWTMVLANISDAVSALESKSMALFDEQARAIAALALLETVTKVSAHEETVRRAHASAATLRSPSVETDAWPDLPNTATACQRVRKAALSVVASTVPSISPEAHNPVSRDLLGQIHTVLFEAAFTAALSGDSDQVTTLFPSVFQTALDAHRRHLAGVDELHPLPKQTPLLRPWVDLIELSGAVLLFDQIGIISGAGDNVIALWTKFLSETSIDVAVLIQMVEDARMPWTFEPGRFARSDRQRRISEFTRQRYFDETPYTSIPTSIAVGPPIITALGLGGFVSQYDTADLFAATFLLTRCADLIHAPQRITELRERLDGLGVTSQPTNSSTEAEPEGPQAEEAPDA